MAHPPQTLLDHARQVHAIGPRPLSARPVLGCLRKAIAAGIVGFALHASAAIAPAMPVAPEFIAQAPEQTVPAAFVDTELQRRAHAGQLEWISRDGQVDGLALINLWKSGDVTPDQAFDLISLLAWTQSPVIARDPAVAAQARDQAAATQGLLDVRTGEQAQAFLDAHSLDKLMLAGHLHSSQAQNVLPSGHRDWEAVVNYWQFMSSDLIDEVASLPVASDQQQDMPAARQQLLQAVDRAGLAGLRVPLSTFNDSENLATLAERIDRANLELQRATGWAGPVLGLRNRVVLTVMSPLNISMAFPEEHGRIGLVTAWEDLSHEWVHGVDLALRTAPGQDEIAGGYTLTQQLTQMPAQGPVQSLWQALPDRLQKASEAGGGRWYQDRAQAIAQWSQSDSEDDRWHADYVSTAHETLAFAWQSHMAANAHQGDLLSTQASTKTSALDGIKGPTAEEDVVLGPVWRQTMTELGRLWWSPPPTLANQLAQRRGLGVSRAPGI